MAVADAVEDHPRLRFEDCCTDLLSEPVSGDADGRFDRLEEVEAGISRSQLVGDRPSSARVLPAQLQLPSVRQRGPSESLLGS